MRYLQLGLAFAGFQCLLVGAVEVVQVGPNANIDHGKIKYTRPGSDFEESFGCAEGSGKGLSFSRDKQYVACCAPGQHLGGSQSTQFLCCGEGHDVAGSGAHGYHCCPIGMSYDGKMCHEGHGQGGNHDHSHDGHNQPQAILTRGGGGGGGGGGGDGDGDEGNGNGKNPPHKGNPGWCQSPETCNSGVDTGKCYLFKMENGQYLGYDSRPAVKAYTAGQDSATHHMGKFRFCKDQNCTRGCSVNPGEGFAILDIHGASNTGAESNNFLDAKPNGGHIGKTPDYSTAGRFTITKWTCGKYCLGGFGSQGVGPTCPSLEPALTFNTLDAQSCLPLTLVEVPCDVRDRKNNCRWDKTPGSCGPGDGSHCHCNKS